MTSAELKGPGECRPPVCLGREECDSSQPTVPSWHQVGGVRTWPGIVAGDERLEYLRERVN